MTQENEEDYLSPNDASEYLGVSRRTLERYVERGLIQRYKREATRQVFFKRPELAEFVQQYLKIKPDKGKKRRDDTN